MLLLNVAELHQEYLESIRASLGEQGKEEQQGVRAPRRCSVRPVRVRLQ